MKKILFGALLALASLAAIAATTTPVQLLSPTGSTSGQVIKSNGPSSAPTWGAPSISTVTGTLPIANGGTGATSAATALSNLGAAPTASPVFAGTATFNGNQLLLGGSQTAPVGMEIGSTTNSDGDGYIDFHSSGTGNDYDARIISSGGTITGTGALTFNGGAFLFEVRPTFAGNTPWDSGNLNFASPPAIGGTTPAAGAFTTLSSTGAFTPSQTAGIVGTTTNNNANAGSFGELLSNTTLATNLPNNTSTNATSVSLTAGDWDCSGTIGFDPAGGTTLANVQAGITTTSATIPTTIGTRTIDGNSKVAGATVTIPTPIVRMSLSGTTTVYLVSFASVSGSTATVDGFIRCRRAR